MVSKVEDSEGDREGLREGGMDGWMINSTK